MDIMFQRGPLSCSGGRKCHWGAIRAIAPTGSGTFGFDLFSSLSVGP